MTPTIPCPLRLPARRGQTARPMPLRRLKLSKTHLHQFEIYYFCLHAFHLQGKLMIANYFQSAYFFAPRSLSCEAFAGLRGGVLQRAFSGAPGKVACPK